MIISKGNEIQEQEDWNYHKEQFLRTQHTELLLNKLMNLGKCERLGPQKHYYFTFNSEICAAIGSRLLPAVMIIIEKYKQIQNGFPWVGGASS